jgi:chorismate mutase
MESSLNRKLKFDSGWEEWSNYVLITLEKLSEEISRRDKERAAFREKMLVDLLNLREALVEKIAESEQTNKKNIDEVVEKIEAMIHNVSEDYTLLSDKFITFKEGAVTLKAVEKIETMIHGVSKDNTALSDKFVTFKENIITPLRIKIAVLSIIGGAVGGMLVYCIVPLMIAFFSKLVIGG